MKYSYRLYIFLLLLAIIGTACASAEVPTRAAPVIPTQSPATTVPLPKPTDTPLPTPTLAPVSTDTPAPPTAPPQAMPLDENLFAVVNVASNDVLNMRDAAGVSNAIAGTLPYFANGIKIAKATPQIVDGAPWVLAQYVDMTGWVNQRYLARQIGTVDDAVAARAAEIIFSIKNNDITHLATLVHPEKGVRFSPYTFVNNDDLVFAAADLPALFAVSDTHLWGYFDGSGEAIKLSGANYWAKFIYDANFAQPKIIGFNQSVGHGNTINNISEIYPDGVFVEYHFPGFDPKYDGMDWRSLRLVLEEYQGQWFLVGIVHDEWSI